VKRCLLFTLGCGVLGADVALTQATSLIRGATATALQLGISSGVGLMLLLQSKIAERDDAIRVQKPRTP
jgi:xanthine/uracil/vitamin C permease (AzgA family)